MITHSHTHITHKVPALTATGYTYTAAADEEIDWLHVQYTSSATAGNRNVRVSFLDASLVEYADFHAGQAQAASVVRHYVFMHGVPREGNFVDNEIICAIPHGFYLPAGWSLKIEDASAVSAADTILAIFQGHSLDKIER